MKRAPGPPRGAGPAGATGSVRIIAGRWRGTRLPVAGADGLRPTSDRVRETLFNWLGFEVPGARCLDLFAGSGALGLEAASRGAAEVVLIERGREAVRLLEAAVGRLRAEHVQVVQSDSLTWLAGQALMTFDIVFLDPPFASDHWEELFRLLPAWLAPQALVYVESAVDAVPQTPAGWVLHRDGQTREAAFALYRVRGSAADTLPREDDPAQGPITG